LGGGSADAAAVLRAVRRANPELAPALDWPEIAASLGADVPACLVSRAAFVRGTGEIMELLTPFPSVPAVLVNPGVPPVAAKTSEVFSRFRASGRPAQPGTPSLPTFPGLAAVAHHAAGIGNDLLPAALDLWPALARILDALGAAEGCLAAGLSGAGPTCFGVFANRPAAAAAGAGLGVHGQWWVRAVTLS